MRYCLLTAVVVVCARLSCTFAQCPSIDYAQRSTYAPYVAAGWDTVIGCTGQGVWLQATSVVTSATFNGTYRVESIPFNPPHPFNTGTQIFLNEDDKFAAAISLPFGFCFFGQTFNTACVGANGVISMGSSMARQNCEYDYSRFSPIPNTRFPIKNAIYGIYEDIDPRVRTNVTNRGIYQAVVGQYPCRQLCVSWNGIAQYGRSFLGISNSSLYSTYQIVLHEGTNIIDVYVKIRKCCSTTNNGLGTIGIQNAAGTSAFTAPGRNGWTGDIDSSEAWRFIPQGPLNYTVTWYSGTDTSAASGTVVGRGDSLFVAPTTTSTYTARLTYMACNGLSYDLTTLVTVGIDTCRASVSASALQVCPMQEVQLSLSTPPCAYVKSVLWSNGDTSRSTTVQPAATTQYSVAVTYHNGCVDTIIQTIAVSDTMLVSHSDTVVENQLPWTYRGRRFPAATSNASFVYNDTMGCPVRESYSLHVWHNVLDTADSTVCENGLPLVWNNHTFASAGTYTTTFAGGASHGEDSTLTMRLMVSNITNVTIRDTVVENSLPTTVCGTAVSTGASDTIVRLTTVNNSGCDSLVEYRLHVWRNVQAEADSIVCHNKLPIVWNGQTFVGGGSCVVNLLTTHGADSTLTMTVSVVGNPAATVRDTVVERGLPHSYRQRTYSAPVSGDTFVVANTAGCDSIVTYSLHIWYNTTGQTDTVVCHNMLPLQWHGHLFDTVSPLTTAMSRVDTLIGVGMHGVDSILTMTLYVGPVYSVEVFDTICNDIRLLFCSEYCDSSGVYVCHSVTGNGCDSIVTLRLTIKQELHRNVYDTVYERELPYSRYGLTLRDRPAPRGMTQYDTSSLYTIYNTIGCDSVIHYELHLYLNSYDTVVASCCVNQLPFVWLGYRFDVGGIVNDTMLSHNGADSIVSFLLAVHDTSHTTMQVSACDGYRWIDGYRYTASTTSPVVTLRTVYGCDSIVHLDLTVYQVMRTVESVVACDSFVWDNGHTYFVSTNTATKTFEGSSGCDSIVTLNLAIYNSRHTELTDTLCSSERYRFGAGRMLSDPGTYYDTLRTYRGCDSTVTLHLAVRPQPSLAIVSEYQCRTANYLLTAQSNVDCFLWNSVPYDPALNEQETNRVVSVNPQQTTVYTVTADYYQRLTCPSFSSVTLDPVPPINVELEVSPTFLTHDRNLLTAIDRSHGHIGRNWFIDGEYMGSNAYVYYTNIDKDSIPVMLEVYNNICRDTAYRLVQVRKYALWIPTAFTPDAKEGSDVNRTFAAVGEGIAEFEMNVYSRNGVLVFHSSNIHDGWDGTYRGQRCPQGAYTYVIRYRHIGTNEAYGNETGAVLLIR
ncbi:MAG: gliding motility-associated C-terminal domain-containing protein [Bacteroidales bacterium]|nr:gliding motility-associated C-terminal domain-containing protein [Bacteroidales bacterium]